jgi:hypothetical protein
LAAEAVGRRIVESQSGAGLGIFPFAHSRGAAADRTTEELDRPSRSAAPYQASYQGRPSRTLTTLCFVNPVAPIPVIMCHFVPNSRSSARGTKNPLILAHWRQILNFWANLGRFPVAGGVAATSGTGIFQVGLDVRSKNRAFLAIFRIIMSRRHCSKSGAMREWGRERRQAKSFREC